MRIPGLCLSALLFASAPCGVAADEAFAWPDGQRMAISLSYDDAIDSQLDNALPALNRHGFKASFYLTLASPTVHSRLDDWRSAAAEGHELGNHTIFHPCSAALPDRDWVASYYDIDSYEIAEIVHEVTVANSFLHAIDGRDERTFTPPCADVIVSGGNYIPAIRSLFVAVKGFEEVEPGFATSFGPAGESGAALIERISDAAAGGNRLVNVIFHGIGGDYLTTSVEAHDQLLQYLADNREQYWVAPYIDIMKHLSAARDR